MRNLLQVKMESINLEVITERILVTTIDIFGFMYVEDSNFIAIFIGDVDCDRIDEIYVQANTLTVESLEEIALKWISEHVKLVGE